MREGGKPLGARRGPSEISPSEPRGPAPSRRGQEQRKHRVKRENEKTKGGLPSTKGQFLSMQSHSLMTPTSKEKIKQPLPVPEAFKEPKPGFPLGSPLNCVPLLGSVSGIMLVILSHMLYQLPTAL